MTDEPQREARAYPKDKGQADILDCFAFHPATEVTGPLHDRIRSRHKAMAETILSTTPAGRHQSLALTALQESMMWCNAAIACDTPKDAR